MEIPDGKCLSCGKMVKMWRCGDVTGGGTYHIVCLECSEKDSRQIVQLTALLRRVGWVIVAGFLMVMFYFIFVFMGN